MLKLMSEIVVKQKPVPVKKVSPPPAKAYAPVRPHSAGHPLIMHGAASDLGYYEYAPTVLPPDAAGRRPGVHPGRRFGSKPPRQQFSDYASQYPKKCGMFDKLSPEEALDRLAGNAGTTLPSAVELAATRDAFYSAAEEAKAERAQAAQEYAALHPRPDRSWIDGHRPQSMRGKFASGTSQIVNGLIQRLETGVNRHEDHARRLIRTFATDPVLSRQPGGRTQLRVTPSTFPRVCDRLGVPCDAAQAEAIFAGHGLPVEGVSLLTLADTFLNSRRDLGSEAVMERRRIHGNANRPPTVQRPRTPPPQRTPLYAYAHLQVAAGRPSSAAQSTTRLPISFAAPAAPAAPATPAAPARPLPISIPAPVPSVAAAVPRQPPPPAARVEPAMHGYAGMSGGTRAAATFLTSNGS